MLLAYADILLGKALFTEHKASCVPLIWIPNSRRRTYIDPIPRGMYTLARSCRRMVSSVSESNPFTALSDGWHGKTVAGRFKTGWRISIFYFDFGTALFELLGIVALGKRRQSQITLSGHFRAQRAVFVHVPIIHATQRYGDLSRWIYVS